MESWFLAAPRRFPMKQLKRTVPNTAIKAKTLLFACLGDRKGTPLEQLQVLQFLTVYLWPPECP